MKRFAPVAVVFCGIVISFYAGSARAQVISTGPLEVSIAPLPGSTNESADATAAEDAGAPRVQPAGSDPLPKALENPKPKSREPFASERVQQSRSLDSAQKPAASKSDSPPVPPFMRGLEGALRSETMNPSVYRSPTGPSRIWVEWECDPPQRFTGRFRLRNAAIQRVQRLGSTGDEVATLRTSTEQIDIFPGVPRSYDGFVLDTDVQSGALLILELQGEHAGDSSSKTPAISLASLSRRPATVNLPGDVKVRIRKEPQSLSLLYNRANLIFEPAEEFGFEVLSDSLRLRPGTSFTCSASLLPARKTKPLQSASQKGSVEPLGVIQGLKNFRFRMPKDEGAYDILVQLRVGKRLISTRRLQCVVLDPSKPPVDEVSAKAKWQLLSDVSLEESSRLIEAGEWNVLCGLSHQKPVGGSGEVFRALRVLGTSPNTPHMLDFVLAGNEPSDYQVHVVETVQGRSRTVIKSEFRSPEGSAELSNHKLLFWPTQSRVTVLVKQSGNIDQKFSTRLRISAKEGRLKPGAPTLAIGRRKVTAFLNSPVLGDRFGTLGVQTSSGREIRDWQYFLESGQRSLEYLNNSGFASVMMTVAGGGANIYPSESIAESTKFDNGNYFSGRAGLPRKDVLEMMFRLFDREKMMLVPVVRFDFPISSLESHSDADASSIRLINRKGQSWHAANPDHGARGRYYNSLNPLVQHAIQNITEEIISRYGLHRSFGGIAVMFDDNTYIQPPEDNWARDSETNALMSQAVKTNTQGSTQFVDVRDLESQWRADEVRRLLANIAASLIEENHKLFILDNDRSPSDAYKRLRQDLTSNAKSAVWPIVWVNGKRIEVAGGSSRRAGPAPSNFIDADKPLLLGEMEKQTAVFVPNDGGMESAGPEARAQMIRRIINTDADMIVHELPSMTSGQAFAKRSALLALQSLPAGEFQEVVSTRNQDRSLRVRTATSPVATYVYAANNSDWPASIRLSFSELGDTTLQSAAAKSISKIDDRTLEMRLEAHNVCSMRIATPGLRILNWSVVRNAEDTQQMLAWCDRLAKHIASARTAGLEERIALLNPDFQTTTSSGAPTDWSVSRGIGIISTVIEDPRAADNTLMLHTQPPHGWPTAPIGWARSNTFTPEGADRLLIVGKVRAADDFATTQMRMVLNGRLGDQLIREEAWLRGADLTSSGGGYRQIRIQLDAVQPSKGDELQVVFEVHGGGQVWIDHVGVYDAFLNQQELAKIESLHRRAVASIKRGDYASCLELKEQPLIKRLMKDIPDRKQIPIQVSVSDSKPPLESDANETVVEDEIVIVQPTYDDSETDAATIETSDAFKMPRTTPSPKPTLSGTTLEKPGSASAVSSSRRTKPANSETVDKPSVQFSISDQSLGFDKPRSIPSIEEASGRGGQLSIKPVTINDGDFQMIGGDELSPNRRQANKRNPALDYEQRSVNALISREQLRASNQEFEELPVEEPSEAKNPTNAKRVSLRERLSGWLFRRPKAQPSAEAQVERKPSVREPFQKSKDKPSKATADSKASQKTDATEKPKAKETPKARTASGQSEGLFNFLRSRK